MYCVWHGIWHCIWRYLNEVDSNDASFQVLNPHIELFAAILVLKSPIYGKKPIWGQIGKIKSMARKQKCYGMCGARDLIPISNSVLDYVESVRKFSVFKIFIVTPIQSYHDWNPKILSILHCLNTHKIKVLVFREHPLCTQGW